MSINMFNWKKKHRFLIIARVGDNSLHQGWLEPRDQINFDLCISYYGDEPDRYKEDSDFYFARKGPKWPIIKEIVDLLGDKIKQYDAVWVPDDDLKTNANTIHQMFETFVEQKLELAQPALTRDSYYSHSITLQKSDYLLRYSPFVEIMAPIFSRNFLHVCSKTFDINQSGWGIDLIWPTLLDHSDRKIAIIDHSPVKHTRPIRTGEIYKLFSVSPDKELSEIEVEYNVNRSTYRLLHTDGILKARKIYFLILAHQEEEVLSEQIKNIRYFNPDSGIILYNGGTNPDFAKNLDIAICPKSHPVQWGKLVRVFWDVMKWLEEMQVDYEYLMNLDHDMLFIKPGFEEFLNSAIKNYDCMGWYLLNGTDVALFPSQELAKSLWREWTVWQPIFKTDTFYRYFNPGQVYRHKIIKKMLDSLYSFDQKTLEDLFENNKVFALEEMFWVTLAKGCGGKCGEYPDGNHYNKAVRWGKDIRLDEVSQIIEHPTYFWIHPVKGKNLIRINRWLLSPTPIIKNSQNKHQKRRRRKKLITMKKKNRRKRNRTVRLKNNRIRKWHLLRKKRLQSKRKKKQYLTSKYKRKSLSQTKKRLAKPKNRLSNKRNKR